MKKIENKAILSPRIPEIVDKPPKEKNELKTPSNEEINPVFRIEGNSNLRKLHPKLAEHYDDLNTNIELLDSLGWRSSELRMKYTTEVQRLRLKIKEYEKNEGITRDDHIRWNKG